MATAIYLARVRTVAVATTSVAAPSSSCCRGLSPAVMALPRRRSKRSASVAAIGATLLAIIVLLLSPGDVSAFSSSSSSSSSSTGSSNSTIPSLADDDGSSLPALPVSNQVAIGLMAGAVVGMCCCLFFCARSQMKQSTSNKVTGAGSGLSAKMQAKLAAARRGWRKAESDGGGGAAGGFAGGARAPLDVHGSHEFLQRSAMIHLSGASIGGLGACRYSDFAAEDFLDEAWATAPNVESLRRSGCILDVVLAARASMVLSGMTAAVPFVVAVLLPFHKMLLAKMELTDWYGRIEAVQFERCLFMSCGALAFHLLAVGWARVVYRWDRAPSVARHKEAQKMAARMEAQKAALVGAVDGIINAASAGGAAAEHHPAPSSTTVQLTPVVPLHSPFTVARSYTLSTLPPSRPSMLKHLGHVATPTAVSPTANTTATTPHPDSEGGGPSATAGTALPFGGLLPPAPVVFGDDPPRWPLALLCGAGMLSYALFGWQGYWSLDESLGRRYEWTDTPRSLWPSQDPRAPEITLLVCFILGSVALVPLAFSLRLLALFVPRKVHPHLLTHID